MVVVLVSKVVKEDVDVGTDDEETLLDDELPPSVDELVGDTRLLDDGIDVDGVGEAMTELDEVLVLRVGPFEEETSTLDDDDNDDDDDADDEDPVTVMTILEEYTLVIVNVVSLILLVVLMLVVVGDDSTVLVLVVPLLYGAEEVEEALLLLLIPVDRGTETLEVDDVGPTRLVLFVPTDDDEELLADQPLVG